VIAAATPPKAKPQVKPKPKPLACARFAIQQTTVRVGEKSKVTLRVTRGGKGLADARIHITGPGVNKYVITGRNGNVVATVNASRTGIITLRLTKPAGCAVKRVGVLGALEPPVTG
jgi:autotransporter translocation and assembly factor TamB